MEIEKLNLFAYSRDYVGDDILVMMCYIGNISTRAVGMKWQCVPARMGIIMDPWPASVRVLMVPAVQ